MIKSWIAALAAACLLSGCATVTRGTTEEVRVEVDPPDAAITTTIGHSCTGIPCRIQAPRKTEFSVTAAKPGYQPQTVFVGTRFSGGGAAGLGGNILIGGLVGVGVDSISGATLDHYPNPVLIALQPVDATNKATPPGRLNILEEKLKAEAAERSRKKAAKAGS